jgi:hypothetical protein
MTAASAAAPSVTRLATTAETRESIRFVE